MGHNLENENSIPHWLQKRWDVCIKISLDDLNLGDPQTVEEGARNFPTSDGLNLTETQGHDDREKTLKEAWQSLSEWVTDKIMEDSNFLGVSFARHERKAEAQSAIEKEIGNI